MFSRASVPDVNKPAQNMDIKTDEFFQYITSRNLDKIREYFSNPEYKVWQLKDENGYTALHKSVFIGDFETTKLIIDEIKKRLGFGSTAAVSKFINEKNNEGVTALHYAAYKGNMDLFDLLIKNGASVEAVTNLGKNVLHMAAEGNQPSMIIYLISQHGQDILSVDENGSTPLHWACYSGSEESVNFLIYLNAKIDAQDKEKLTPLHLAALGGKEKIVLRLLQKNADKSLSNAKGELAIDLAKKKNHTKIVQLLEDDDDYNPLCSLETPKKYVEPKDIYKKLVFFMIGIPEIVIFIFVLPFLDGYVNLIINLISFIITIFSYFVLTKKDPGYKINEMLIKEAGGSYPLKNKVLEKVDVRNYCPKCFMQKNFNITHCYICDKCVLGYHHHCFWINKCIGKNNVVFYVLFVFFALFYANHSLFICLVLFFDDVNLPYENNFFSWLNFTFDKGYRVLGGALVGVYACICAFPLWFLFLIAVLKIFGLYGYHKRNDLVIKGDDNEKDDINNMVELQGTNNEPLLPKEENDDHDTSNNAINTGNENDENEIKTGENNENVENENKVENVENSADL